MIKYKGTRFYKKHFRRMKMDKKLIDRINQLSQKSKTQGLTVGEKEEQQKLRKEYLNEFKSNFRKQLENIEITYVD